MGEIHKLTKDGITLFPATITDAIAHPELRTTLSNLITVYNVSNLYPNNNITTLNEAIELLKGKLKDEQKVSGIKVQFISETGLQEWMYNGNTFDNLSNWSRCDSWYTYTDEETPDINDLEILTADALRKTKQDLTNEERKQVKENIGIAESVISTTWADLKERKDSGTLIPGQYYEINDYKTTTTQENTKTAEHYFNILVEATSTTELNSEAKATISNRDTYFNGIELNKWTVRYDIENNQTKYAWADPVNGRGTIYYLKDEWNNEAWYDFKNIQFLRNCNDEKYSWIELEENQYFYTFSRIETGNIIDDSLGTGQYPSSDNHLGRSTAKITKLNNTIFIGNGAFANEIADGHRDNTIGEGTWLNKIGHNFIENNITGVFQENNIGSKFSKNILYKFTKNTILNDCDSNVFSRVFTQNIIESGFKNNVFLFADSNELGTVSGCKFGNNITKVIDIPACFEKVTIDNNALNLSTETSTTKIILFDGKNLSTLINELDNEDSGIEKRGVVISKFRDNLVYNINSSIGIYDLGEFNTSGDAENAAKQINISYNKNISIIKYSVIGNTPGEGIIFQQVDNLNTTQRLYWGGKIYKRQLTFTILAGNIASTNDPSWTEVLEISGINYSDSKIQLKNNTTTISEVEIPEATDTTPGLMSAEDKLGIGKISESICDIGDCSDWNDMLTKSGATEISGNQKIRLIYFSISAWGKCGVIEQQTGQRTGGYGNTLQTLKWDNCESIRYLTYNSSGEVTNAGLDFRNRRTMPTEIYYKPGEKKISLRQKGNGDNYIQGLDGHADFGTYELPIATPSVYSVVKLDSDYTKDTKGTALSLAGAKTLNENKLDKQIEITYSDLVSKRDNSELIPGQKYRIIDYVTTTAQENTTSAGHQFDIIVEALSENVLNEVASACLHEGDTYFEDSNLEAWELKYCLDNDTSKFAWAENNKIVIDSTNVTIQESLVTENIFNTPFLPEYYIYIDATGNKTGEYTNDNLSERGNDYFIEWGRETTPDGLENQLCIYKNDLSNEDYIEGGAEEGIDYGDKFFYWGTEDVDGITYDKWKKYEIDSNNWKIDTGEVVYLLTPQITNGEVIDSSYNNGKGVIYCMKDEYNNECPYDFKNIQFYNNTNNTFFYTFSWVNENNEIEDLTLRQDLKSDEETPYGTYNNTIKPYYNVGPVPVQQLNNIIFVSTHSYDSGFFYGCYSNSFGNNCHNNSFGNDCYNNSFGDGCYNNSFGDSCYFNSFGNNCSSNIFGNYCNSNSFGNDCDNNSFGNMCYNNSFGNKCYNNSFGNRCGYNSFENNSYSNSFGNKCLQIIFGEGCSYNSFGNECHDNEFRAACEHNSFGNSCSSNSFVGECYSNSFGNECHGNNFLGIDCFSNSFGNECYNNSFGTDCSYNSFGNYCNSNSFGESCSSNSFGNMCYNNSFGNECHSNSFENDCNNNSFGNSYFSNSFGNSCDNNSFGNNCHHNSFGNNCSSNIFGNYCYSNSFGNDCDNNSFRDSPDYSYDSNNDEYIPNGKLLDYFNNNHFSDGCNNIIFWSDQTDAYNKIQNLNISQGLGSTEIDDDGNSIPEVIRLTVVSQDYEIKIARNSKGEVKIYCEADLIG